MVPPVQEMIVEARGLTRKELAALMNAIQAVEGVETVNERVGRSYPPTVQIQASAAPMIGHIVIGFLGAQAMPGVKEFTKAVGKKTGDAVGDVVASWIKRKFTGASAVEVSVSLIDADGNLVREIKSKR